MNPHDRYFTAQRVSLAPRTTGTPLHRARRPAPLRTFALGVAVGAALSYAAMSHAAPPLMPIATPKTCEIEAMTARSLAEARDAGQSESTVHARLDKVAATHPELALTEGDIRREHASIAEVWSLRHLTPDSIFAFTLHRCLYGRVAS